MPSHLVFFPQLKRRNNYPRKKSYNKYRNEIREDSQYRCVYCDIHEIEMSYHPETRDQRMTLDHFRPQSLYKTLSSDPNNLVLCCPVCNNKKADDWPAYGQPHGGSIDGNVGYIDPFLDNRLEYFEIIFDGTLKSLKPPANYMIRVLLLNRPAMKKIRSRRIQLHENLAALESYFQAEIISVEAEIRLLTNDNAKAKKTRKKLIQLKTMQLTLETITKMIELY